MNKGKKFSYNKKYNILLAIAAIIILVYILYSIYKLIKAPTDVFIVSEGKVSLEESVTGYLIREETVIQGQNYQNGMVQIKAEGEKVAKGESVFRYYSNNEEQIKKKIEEIDGKINEALKNQKDLLPNDVKAIEKHIEQTVEGINSNTEIEKIQEYKNDIATYLTKKSKIAGELSPAGSYIKNLYQERSIYENQLNTGTEYVKATTSGIVSYRVDNLEKVLTPDDFTKINKQVLEELNIKTGQIVATNNQTGKVVNNFECYMATIMNSENAKSAKVGDKLTIRLSTKDEIPATVQYTAVQDDDSVLLVFKITSKVEELVSYRKASFDVIWWSNTGLKVPNSAIIYQGDLAYVIRNRAGYLDKLLVKKIKETPSYTLIGSYETDELKELGYTTEQIKNINSVSLYDELILHPTDKMLQ